MNHLPDASLMKIVEFTGHHVLWDPVEHWRLGSPCRGTSCDWSGQKCPCCRGSDINGSVGKACRECGDLFSLKLLSVGCKRAVLLHGETAPQWRPRRAKKSRLNLALQERLDYHYAWTAHRWVHFDDGDSRPVSKQVARVPGYNYCCCYTVPGCRWSDVQSRHRVAKFQVATWSDGYYDSELWVDLPHDAYYDDNLELCCSLVMPDWYWEVEHGWYYDELGSWGPWEDAPAQQEQQAASATRPAASASSGSAVIDG